MQGLHRADSINSSISTCGSCAAWPITRELCSKCLIAPANCGPLPVADDTTIWSAISAMARFRCRRSGFAMGDVVLGELIRGNARSQRADQRR